jgi:CII-binding regulator of phage lambda lysogenization HflD
MEESPYQKRDFTLALAGFLAGIHSLRILAEKGVASADDMEVSLDGIRRTLATMPVGMIPDEQMAGIEQMLEAIHQAAIAAEGTSEEPEA